jgi:hypothetical protein
MQYQIRRTRATPELRGDWDGPAWKHADVAVIDKFLPESSDHHPRTEAKVLYDDAGLYVHFRLFDRYVLCKRTYNHELTSKDSCVEVYFEPFPGEKGYLNFEMSCGGALLLFYITDPIRAPRTIFKERIIVSDPLIATMRIAHSLPEQIEKEITEPVNWWVEYFIPYSLFEHYVGPLGPPEKRKWRGNFFKCADESSHPHWASWSQVHEFNFHVPKYFGSLKFKVD